MDDWTPINLFFVQIEHIALCTSVEQIRIHFFCSMYENNEHGWHYILLGWLKKIQRTFFKNNELNCYSFGFLSFSFTVHWFFCEIFNALSKFHWCDDQKRNAVIIFERGNLSGRIKSNKNAMFSSIRRTIYFMHHLFRHRRVVAIAIDENGDKLNRLTAFFTTTFSRLAKINRELTFDR